MAEIHLSRDVLSALQEVMEGEYSALLDTFLADSESRLQQLRNAQSPAQIIEAAHSFKGSSSNLGALRLAELCCLLERQAKDNPLGDVQPLIADIVGEFALVRPLYEAERQRSVTES
ncbi:Hpt domain-containing protein [Pseudomonas vancouverensis]|uniref:Hpt domain-containing protein n=1 Tax=Pseudomonas vancouverensis TaxID=95300 RepID=UPI003D0612A9